MVIVDNYDVKLTMVIVDNYDVKLTMVIVDNCGNCYTYGNMPGV